MSVRARWAVRIATVAFGLLIGGISILDAVVRASNSTAPADGSGRQAVLLSMVGGLLKGLGIAGVFVCQAAEFRDWSSWFRPLRPLPGARLGLRGARRAARQINGAESYRSDEVARLRQLAEHRVSLHRFNLVGRLAAVSLIVFFAGIVLAPPGIDIGSATASALAQVFRLLGIVMAVALVAACIVSWRATADEKAQAFLERTAPANPHAPSIPTPDQDAERRTYVDCCACRHRAVAVSRPSKGRSPSKEDPPAGPRATPSVRAQGFGQRPRRVEVPHGPNFCS